MTSEIAVIRGILPPLRLSPWLLLSLLIAAPSSATQSGDERRIERREVHVIHGGGDEPVLMLHGLAEGRTYLGVHLVNLTPELIAHFEVAAEAGVMVSRVADGSPAATADLRAGDILTAVDGKPIGSASRLAREIAARDEGDLVNLEVWRKGRLLSVSATLAARPRPQLDIRPFLWHGEGDGHGNRLLIPGEDFEEDLELDRETLDDALETLRRQFDSDLLQDRMRFFHEHGDRLLERLEQLEERLERLERELEKLPADDS